MDPPSPLQHPPSTTSPAANYGPSMNVRLKKWRPSRCLACRAMVASRTELTQLRIDIDAPGDSRFSTCALTGDGVP
jgi:hypothetical protein